MNGDKNTYYASHPQHAEWRPGMEILREFDCKNLRCKRHVVVVEKRDKRTSFCCPQCEKQYWRDVTRHDNGIHKRGGNNGMSGGMSLGSLIRRERRDLL